MTTTTNGPFALRLALARGLVDAGDFAAAASALAELVAEASTEEASCTTPPSCASCSPARTSGRPQLGRAEAVLRDLVEEQPTDGWLHLLLGRTLQRQAPARRRPPPPRPGRGARRLRAARRLR